MEKFSRRKFLKQFGAVAALFLTSRTAFSLPELLFSDDAKDFEMLVVGDSLVSGQGVKEKNRFYYLTKEWLQNEIFGEDRRVSLKVKAHSGSRLFLHENEIKALEDAEKNPDEFYHPEVNFNFPDTKTQIDVAKKEYEKEGKSADDVNLIMVTGGITNISTSYIGDPFKDSKGLRQKIKKYCNDWMFRFLQHANKTFPNALIAVIGYYQYVSKYSSSGKIYNAALELYDFPRFTKPLMNNILTKQFFKILHNKMSKRSRTWRNESDREFRNAVSRFNQLKEKEQAIYIESPITDKTCFGTEDSLLWGLGKKGRLEDEFYDVRLVECKKAIDGMKNVNLKFKTRFCELSAIGHPNIEGSKAYAEAIKTSLKSKVLTLKSVKN